MPEALASHLAGIPLSIAGPAFRACLCSASSNTDLIDEFKRLTGLDKIDMTFARRFVGFVHEYVYTRLDEKSLEAMRSNPDPSEAQGSA